MPVWAPIKRMWINQPSKAQSLHHLHGTNVLAARDDGGTMAYFLDGDTVSMIVLPSSLSEGWVKK